MIVFPGRPRVLLLSMIRGIRERYRKALVLSDALLRFAAGSAMIYLSSRMV